MPMITFAVFIVVTQHALPSDDIGKPVFESMYGWRNRLEKKPNQNLGKCIRRQYNTALDKCGCLHVGLSNNARACCQQCQRLSQFGLDQIVDHARIGLALAFAHDLAHEKSQQFGLAGFIGLDLRGVGRDDFVHDVFQG